MEGILKERMNTVEGLIERMKKREEVSITELLKEEIEKLKRLNEEYEAVLTRKSVCQKEEKQGKIKYTLSDGSIYVVNKRKGYKYLYDSCTSIITYEFENGQVERTFPGGIKEIRASDGRILIKTSEREYDVVKGSSKK